MHRILAAVGGILRRIIHFKMRGVTNRGKIDRLLYGLLFFLAISAAYLYAFPQPNIPYAGVVLLHTAAGLLATILLIPLLGKLVRSGSFPARAGWILIAAGAILGLVLIKTGTPRSEWNKLYAHIVFSLGGVGLLVAAWFGRRSEANERPSSMASSGTRVVLCLALVAGLGYGANYLRQSWQSRSRIENPTMPPATMNGEGDGPQGAFFPSSAQVYGSLRPSTTPSNT